ncbi:MAG: exosortase/archaeosortase family protein [Fimbriimonadaceae bacterium]
MDNEATIESIAEEAEVAEEPRVRITLETVLGWLRLQPVQMGLVIFALMIGVFWPVFDSVPALWFNMNGYHQHGPLVPFAIAYIIYVNWDKFSKIPVKKTWAPLIFLAPLLYLNCAMTRSGFFSSIQTGIMMIALGLILWSMLGFRWAFALIPTMIFATTGLPLWERVIDENTNQLQLWSTDITFNLLKMLGYGPIQTESTTIHLDSYTLYIAVACSGMKLTMAMIASALFIILVARLSWWKNLILAGMALPMAVVINGLRITASGMVGEQYGQDAGTMFHDYGSYIFLVLAFYILYQVSKLLGWKI